MNHNNIGIHFFLIGFIVHENAPFRHGIMNYGHDIMKYSLFHFMDFIHESSE